MSRTINYPAIIICSNIFSNRLLLVHMLNYSGRHAVENMRAANGPPNAIAFRANHSPELFRDCTIPAIAVE